MRIAGVSGDFWGFWFATVAVETLGNAVVGPDREMQPLIEIRGNAPVRRLRSTPCEDNEFRSIFPSTPQF
jgi:hypothetical protein